MSIDVRKLAFFQVGLVFGLFVFGIPFPSSAQPVQLAGGFAAATATMDANAAPCLLKKTPLWDSWEGDDRRTGRFTCGPFALGKTLELYVAGFPAKENEKIYLEDAQSRETLTLKCRSLPGNNWTHYRWSPPTPWIGRSVRLIAVDNGTGPGDWIGLSKPLKPSWQFGPALAAVGLQTYVFALLLLPGIAALLVLPPKNILDALALVPMTSALAAYAIFFIYLGSPCAGQVASWMLLTGCSTFILARWRRFFCHPGQAEFLAPLLFMLIATVFYFIGGFLYGGIQSPAGAPLERFLPSLPPDPLLPHWFAEIVAQGRPLRPFFSDWLTSDRPPLQTGLNLLAWPLVPKELGYLAIGVAAQCWIWLGLWFCLRRMGVNSRACAIVFSGAVFSGFFFLNSFFCWPKLLPAAFLLMTVGFLWGRPRGQALQLGDAVFAAACAALSMLGHGGSIFALLGIAMVYFATQRTVTWRPLVFAALTAGLLMLPWHWYQKYYDPPGDRLTKYHMAGHESIDPRPSFTVIREAYAQAGWRQVLYNKVANVRMLFCGNAHVLENISSTWRETRSGDIRGAFWRMAHCLREAGFFHYFQTLGPMLLGLPGLVRLFFRRRGSAEWTAASTHALLALATSLIWCALMFKGGSTVIHQSSYLIGACLFTIVGLGLAAMPCWVQYAVLTINFAWFFCVWVLAPERTDTYNVLLPASFPGFWLVWNFLFVILAVHLGWMMQLDAGKPAACQPADASLPGNNKNHQGTVVKDRFVKL